MSDFNLGTVTAYGYAKDKGYTGTEDEFAALMASYADVAEQASESATAAAASASTATTKASEASASASAAATSKTAAEAAQSSAETAATTATTKASEASTSAATATSKASEATTAATTATNKATDATTAATTATTKAGEAATSATNAAASAEAAAQSAATLVIDNTLTHAGQAADAKKTGDEISDLKDDFSDILNSAYVTDTASGSIASFPDGADNVPVKSLTVDIEPVQDLHGQDNPYPAGGGVNILDADGYSETTETGTNKTIIVNKPVYLEANQAYTFSCRQVGNAGTVTRNLIAVAEGSTTTILAYEQSNTGTAHVHTVTYTPSTSGYYRPAYWAHTLQNAVTLDEWQVEKGSAFTSYAPYSNICPISGRTSAVVTRCGVNVWDEFWENGSINDNTGEDTTGSGIRSKNYISVTPEATYYFHVGSGATMRLFYYGKDKSYISRVDTGSSTFTVPTNAYYVRFRSFNAYGTTYNHDISINYPSTDHDYHAYNGQTYTIDLDGTRYGGTLDVGTGVLTVDRAMVDLGTLNWQRLDTSTTGKYGFGTGSLVTTISKPSTYRVTGKLCCSILPEIAGDQPYLCVNGIGIHTNGNVILYSDSYATYSVGDLTNAVTGQTLVYPLAEPFTVQLTAQEVTTLKGQNNIWSDAGDVEVEYRADTKLYIEKLTAPTEDDMIADHAISANTFFMVGNTLYRATTTIASGATITVGTNATKLSLADALNALS